MSNAQVNYDQEVAKLSVEDKKILENIWEFLTEDGRKIFREAAEGKEGILQYLVDGYKEKLEAFKNKQDPSDLVAKDIAMAKKIDEEK